MIFWTKNIINGLKDFLTSLFKYETTHNNTFVKCYNFLSSEILFKSFNIRDLKKGSRFFPAFSFWIPVNGTLANSEDPDEMPHFTRVCTAF